MLYRKLVPKDPWITDYFGNELTQIGIHYVISCHMPKAIKGLCAFY